MKKKIVGLFLVLSIVGGALTGCGTTKSSDTSHTFNKAIIKLSDGTVVEGKIDSYGLCGSDTIKVTIEGKTYLVSSMNATLISE